MNKKTLFIFIAVIAIGAILFFIYKNSGDNHIDSKGIASVNGELIEKKELNKEVERMQKFYSSSKQNIENYPSLEKDMLERLIEQRLIEQYAEKNNLKINEDEVKSYYDNAVQREKSEPNLLEKLSEMYGMGKEEYLEKIRMDILREKVQKNVGKPLSEWLTEEKSKAKIYLEKIN